MEKIELRKELRKILIDIGPTQRTEKSRQACKNLVSTESFKKANVVMLFLSLPNEIDTSDAILNAWQHNKIVTVPKISWEQRHILPVEINSLETGFSTEVPGLRNPITGLPSPLKEIDLVVTPGLGFDHRGNRIGRGGAYYDRFFSNPNLKAKRCGFAFSEQYLESVPVDDSDIPMDMLVTDKDVIYFDRT